jgi:hypothetical protein
MIIITADSVLLGCRIWRFAFKLAPDKPLMVIRGAIDEMTDDLLRLHFPGAGVENIFVNGFQACWIIVDISVVVVTDVNEAAGMAIFFHDGR